MPLSALAVLIAPAIYTTLALPPGAKSIHAGAMSDDGRVVFGTADMGESRRLCRWADGKPTLLTTPGTPGWNVGAADTNDSGSDAVGWFDLGSSQGGWRYREGKVTTVTIPTLEGKARPEGALKGVGKGAIIGYAGSIFECDPLLWGSDGARRVLPAIPTHRRTMLPSHISRDGRTVVGYVSRQKDASGYADTGHEPWIWTAEGGSRLLMPLPTYETSPRGISADGRTVLIAGTVQQEDGDNAAVWLINTAGKVEPLIPPTGTISKWSPQCLDVTGRVVALNTTKPYATYLWTRAKGFLPLQRLLGAKVPKRLTLGEVTGLTVLRDGRVRVIGEPVKGNSFIATVTL